VAEVGGPLACVLNRHRALDAGGYDPWLARGECPGETICWALHVALAVRGRRAVVIPEFLLATRAPCSCSARDVCDVLMRYPALSPNPEIPLRLTTTHAPPSSSATPPTGSPASGEVPLRYRVADRINEMIKRTPLHGAIKKGLERGR
jgi:hypothetical protein